MSQQAFSDFVTKNQDGRVSIKSGEDWSTWTELSNQQDHVSYYDNNGNLEGVLTWEYSHCVDPDDGSSTYNYHAVRTRVDMEAGANRGTDWQNDWGRIFTDWSAADSELNIDMRDRQPRGTPDDETYTTTITMGSSGTTEVSYGYSQSAITLVDESSPSLNEAQFQMDVTRGSTPAKSNAEFNPGSMGRITPPGYCRSAGWHVATLDWSTQFYNPNANFYMGGTHSHNGPNIDLDLGC